MFFINILGSIMSFCYNLLKNYGIAIILFTLISKFVLLPLSIWIQKNSIKMVKMQPEINRIKINFFGDKDKIADEQSKLFKKEKYNAFASIIPLTIQIILLLGVVEVINHPMTYIIRTPKELTNNMIQVALENNSDLEDESSSLELAVIEEIKNNLNIDKYENLENINNEITKIKNLNLAFCGFDLSWVAVDKLGVSLLVPLIAGFSSLLLCVAQNMINVLQAEQSKINKYGMLIFSVGLSVYLGAFVPAGVALYWVFSNVFAIIQQWLLNMFINPKKYINYEELKKTTEELKKLNAIKTKNKLTKVQNKKAHDDYKRFFKIVNKHLVFYSESNGFYKYYKGIIEYLLEKTNITIHYITSDYNDNIFELEKQNPQIKAYFIDEKRLITLMMKIDADVVVMTMPDIETYHIKRSYLRKDIEYIYIPHGMDSLNMTMRTCSMNNYDTVYCTGPHQYEECIKTNDYYNLNNRKLVKWGYSLLDDMIEEYSENKKENETKQILIAPSWQKDNIIDLCLDEILENLKEGKYEVVVRPHPQHVRLMREKFDVLKEKYKNNKNIIIQTDFTKNDTVFNADIMMTDWSGIAFEYAFTTKKPVIFIDTPMKVMNPEYKNIDVEPFNIWTREKMGKIVKLDEIGSINTVVENILNNYKEYQTDIEKLTNDSVYNLGNSAKVGADYIIKMIQEKIDERRKKIK